MKITIAGIEAPEDAQRRYLQLVAAVDHGQPVVADYVGKVSDNKAGARCFIVLEAKQKLDDKAGKNRKAGTIGDWYFTTAECDGHGVPDYAFTKEGEAVPITKSRTPQSFSSDLFLLSSDEGKAKAERANLL